MTTFESVSLDSLCKGQCKESTLPDLPFVWEEHPPVVVVDDDPTGCQTVHDVPLLMGDCATSLIEELRGGARMVFVLTNTRSMAEEDATQVALQVGQWIRSAESGLGTSVTVINRGDSTLRGHFPHDLLSLNQGLARPADLCLLVPCFTDGGRLTCNDVHYVTVGDQAVPAGNTKFAQDAAFGYTSSDLKEWVLEKFGHGRPAPRLASLSLNLVRAGGPWAVSRFLDALAPGTYCIVNAITDADLNCVAQGAALCEKGSGRKILYQAAASFVRARGGILRRPLLSPDAALGHTGERGGLTVVGSHVAATTAQLEALLAAEPNVGIELDVADLLKGAAAVLPRLQQIESSLAHGRDVVIYTSRSERRGGSPQESLHMARTISESLCALVAALPLPPRYLIAKGGITSHDLATKALRVQRAVVLGQILPGVPVWRLGNEALFPQLPYVVFPGNVGGPNSLLDLFRLFKATRS